jgi:adenylate kinase
LSHTIVVFGISGVGKSHTISEFVGSKSFVHIQASGLLRSAKLAVEGRDVTAEELRTDDIHYNQTLLISSFEEARSRELRNIIFDGHNLIDNGDRLIEIPAEVVDRLRPAGIIVICADPIEIVSRRQKDTVRSRPVRSVEELQIHQSRCVALGKAHAERLGIPYHQVTAGDGDGFTTAIMSILERAEAVPSDSR